MPPRRNNGPSYDEIQEMYENRRNEARGGKGLAYEDHAFGRDIMDLDTPVEYDREVRKEAFSEMGAALRDNLNQTRGLPPDQRVHVERRSDNPNAPQTIREARQLVNQVQRRAASNSELYDERGRYNPHPGDYDDEPDYYDPRSRRPAPRYREDPPYAYDDEDDEEVDDDDEADEYWRRHGRLPEAPRGRGQRTNRPIRQEPPVPAPRRSSPRPNNPPPPPPPRRRVVQSEPPARRPGGTHQRQRPQELGKPVPAAVLPTRPELLGPDGRVARNPCGFVLSTTIGRQELLIECQEERRGAAPPWHHNMPHVARIKDPGMNAANACFIWYYEDEAPR